jgi:hypothetical protein
VGVVVGGVRNDVPADVAGQRVCSVDNEAADAWVRALESAADREVGVGVYAGYLDCAPRAAAASSPPIA